MKHPDRARKVGRVSTFATLALLLWFFIATTGQDTLKNEINVSYAVPTILGILILGFTGFFLQRKTAGKHDLMIAAIITGILVVAVLVAIGFLVVYARQAHTGDWSDLGRAFAGAVAIILVVPCLLLSAACIGSGLSAKRLSRPQSDM